jgi:hypothetical protein
MDLIIRLTPVWFFPGRIFYFSIGLVAGIHVNMFGDWLKRNKWILLFSSVILLALSIIEYEYLVRLLQEKWLIPRYSGIFRSLYAIAFTLAILAFDKIPIPGSGKISQLGGKSLGIYFVNYPALYIVASLMYYLTPMILGYAIIYQVILITAGLGGSLLAMWIVKKSPARKIYPYFFG